MNFWPIGLSHELKHKLFLSISLAALLLWPKFAISTNDYLEDVATLESCEVNLQHRLAAADSALVNAYFKKLEQYMLHASSTLSSPQVPHAVLNRANPSQLEELYAREEKIMAAAFRPIPGSIKAADRNRSMNALPERRAKQLTGFLRKPGQLDHMTMEIADAFLYFRQDGSVLLMGSGQNYIEYPSLDHMLKRLEGKRKAWDLRYPDGTKILGPYHSGELPWDLNIVRWEDGTEIMYGGAMRPPNLRIGATGNEKAHADIASDNWSRSGHAFEKKIMDGHEVWVMRAHDLFGQKASQNPTWLGHNYGRRIITDSEGKVWRDRNGSAWLIYDKVYDDNGNVPRRTKIFARRMKNYFETHGEEISLVKESDLETPIVERSFGNFDPLGRWVLIEGGNPFTVTLGDETYHGLAASANDFPTDKYPTLVGFRKSANDETEGRIGEYDFLKNSNGTTDLRDLAERIRQKYQISWGPGRPFFFQDSRKKWWLIAHGIDLSVLPEGHDGSRWPPAHQMEHFHRNQYLFPVEIIKVGNEIRITIDGD